MIVASASDTAARITKRAGNLFDWSRSMVSPRELYSCVSPQCLIILQPRVAASVRQNCENRLAVLDFATIDHVERLVPGSDEILNFLVGFACMLAGRQAGGDEYPHPLAENAGRRVIRQQLLKVRGPVTGFFDQLAARRFERCFLGLPSPCRYFDQSLADGYAAAADQANSAIVEKRQDGDGTQVPHKLAACSLPIWPSQRLFNHGEPAALQQSSLVVCH